MVAEHYETAEGNGSLPLTRVFSSRTVAARRVNRSNGHASSGLSVAVKLTLQLDAITAARLGLSRAATIAYQDPLDALG
jgi:hypothetical protein